MEGTDPRADIAFRRRCLIAKTGIYARRNGPAALALLPQWGPVWSRYATELDWMASERPWTPQDEQRIARLCAILLLHSHRGPEPPELWRWHVARLRELLRQYDALVAVERKPSRVIAWPSRPSPARGKTTARRRARQRRR